MTLRSSAAASASETSGRSVRGSAMAAYLGSTAPVATLQPGDAVAAPGTDALTDDLGAGRRRGPPARTGPERAGRLHVRPRAGPSVRDEPDVRDPSSRRSTRRSSTCSRQRRSRSGRPADAGAARARGRRHGPGRALLDPGRDGGSRFERRRRGASTRRAGTPRWCRHRPIGGVLLATRDDALAASCNVRVNGSRGSPSWHRWPRPCAIRVRARRHAPAGIGAADEPRRGCRG